MCDGSNAQEERRGTEHKQKRSASRSRTVRTAQGTVRASKDGRSPNGRGDSSSRDGEGDVRGSVDWSIDERYQCSAIVLRKGEGRKVGATPRTEAGRAVRGGEASGGEERPSGAGRSIEQRAGLARSLERWSRGVRRGCRGSRGRRGLWRRRNSRKKRVRADGRVGAWEQGGRRCRRAARRLVSRAAGPKGQQHGGRAGGRADT